MIKLIYKSTLNILLLVTVVGCARVGSPTGGIKDENPPKVISTSPQNYTTYFSGKDFEMNFNEYVQLKDVSNELLISPPLTEKPEVKIHGKSIKVNINNDLKDSITYTFNFANSIADFTEGNILEGYEYVFSTNNTIDTLTVSGTLLNSFDHKPVTIEETPILIMIYSNLNDSVPETTLPLYLTKVRSDGSFSINNVKPGTYKIFALADNNRNMLFDLVDERIAFSDSLIVLNSEMFGDSLFASHTKISYDTIGIDYPDKKTIRKNSIATPIDSLAYVYTKKRYCYSTNLLLFQEADSTQYLVDFSRPGKSVINLIFKRPVSDSLTIEPINVPVINKDWLLMEDLNYGDTLRYWINDTSISNIDTLLISLGCNVTDTLGNYKWTYDTLKFVAKKEKVKGNRISRKKQENQDEEELIETKEKLTIGCNIASSKLLDLNKDIALQFSNPIKSYNLDSVLLYQVIDTLKMPVKYSIEPDSFNILKYYIKTKLESQTKYELIIYPGAFTDIFSVTNDTFTFSNTTWEKEYYGTLYLKLNGINSNIIIQLFSKDGKMVQEKYANPLTKQVDFTYLAPDLYSLKVIFDRNNNKKWDTGNYKYKIQPEKVGFYNGEIKIRSNWEVEETWDLKE